MLFLILLFTFTLNTFAFYIPQRWQNPIPYKIHNNISYPDDITMAINYYHQVTNVKFVQRTNETDYLEFSDIEGCFSYVGKIGGKQEISISNGCDIGSIIHEIAHAIGVEHEQSRYDRDKYVEIIEENISKDKLENFRRNNRKIDLYYDFDSIMHYGQWDFSNNGKKTIELKVDTQACFIGQRYKLSYHDIVLINEIMRAPGQPKQENNNHLYLCGGRNFKTFNWFYTEYQKQGEHQYRSRWPFRNHYKIIQFNHSYQRWELMYKNSIYGYTTSKSLNSTWNMYNLNTTSLEEDTSSYLSHLNDDNIITPNDDNILTPNHDKFIYQIIVLSILVLFILICVVGCCCRKLF
jgi:hypothetical protein